MCLQILHYLLQNIVAYPHKQQFDVVIAIFLYVHATCSMYDVTCDAFLSCSQEVRHDWMQQPATCWLII